MRNKRLGRCTSSEPPCKKPNLSDESNEQTTSETSSEDQPDKSTSKERILQPAVYNSDSTAMEHLPAELYEQETPSGSKKKCSEYKEVPQFVYSDECDMSKLLELWAELEEDFKSRKVPLDLMSFYMKATSRALLKFPTLNGRVKENPPTFLKSPSHNIGINVITPKGLIVATIKNVQDLEFADVAKQIYLLRKLGKESAIPLTYLTRGTISLFEYGKVAGTYPKPVLPPLQAVVGALGKIQKLPRYDKDGNVTSTSIITVSWTADYRVINSVKLAQFAKLWKEYIERPITLLYEL